MARAAAKTSGTFWRAATGEFGIVARVHKFTVSPELENIRLINHQVLFICASITTSKDSWACAAPVKPTAKAATKTNRSFTSPWGWSNSGQHSEVAMICGN